MKQKKDKLIHPDVLKQVDMEKSRQKELSEAQHNSLPDYPDDESKKPKEIYKDIRDIFKKGDMKPLVFRFLEAKLMRLSNGEINSMREKL